MINMLFQEKEIVLRQYNPAGEVVAKQQVRGVVAIGSGLGYRLADKKWQVVHLPSGRTLSWVAFETQQKAETYIARVARILDWRGSYEAVYNFACRPGYLSLLLEAAKGTWI